MQGNKKDDDKVKKLKEKSKSYRLEKDKEKRKNKDLRTSIALWKEKYKAKVLDVKLLEKRLANAEKELQKGVNSKLKVKRHHYNASQISMCVNLRSSTNSSLRSCVQIIKLLSVIIGLECFRPSISSIRNWEMKMGFEQITRQGNPKEEYVLIVDESIMVGQQKLLLLMGVNLSNYDFKGALNFSHAEVLGLHIGSSCNWKDVKKAIDDLSKRGYVFKYAVSDGGGSICKGLRESSLVRVEDCTHALGLLIKKRYENDQRYHSFSKQSASFKRKVSTSKFAAYMPPTQRSKARFLNLTKVSEWAVKLLRVAKGHAEKGDNKEAYERIKWIETYEDLINDIIKYQTLLNQLFKVLKQKGLTEENQQSCERILYLSEVEDSFKEKVRQYLSSNRAKLPNEKRLICCSDVIESKFGYFKNRMSSNKNVGFTASCLTIANSNKIKELGLIKAAMEGTKLSEIKHWEKVNLRDSLLKRKQQLFKSTVKKYA